MPGKQAKILAPASLDHLVPNEAAKAADKLPDVHAVCTDPDKSEKPK